MTMDDEYSVIRLIGFNLATDHNVCFAFCYCRSRLSRKRSSQKLEASAGEDTEEIEEMEEDNEGSEYEDEDMEFENESARIPSLVSIPKRAREDLNSSLGKMRSNLDTTDMRKNNDLRSKITLGKTGVLVSRLGKQT